MHDGEPQLPHGQDSLKHSANPTLHMVDMKKQSSTSTSQENLLAIKTFLGSQGQSCLSTSCSPEHNLSAYSPRDGILDLGFH